MSDKRLRLDLSVLPDGFLIEYGKWEIIPRGDIGERVVVYVTSKIVG